MTVVRKTARIGGWEEGWTWLQAIYMAGWEHQPMPAFEVLWTEKGEAVHTGRKALLRRKSIDDSQLAEDPPVRYEPDESQGERLLEPDEYSALLRMDHPPRSTAKQE
jgi:hypothetical protein